MVKFSIYLNRLVFVMIPLFVCLRKALPAPWLWRFLVIHLIYLPLVVISFSLDRKAEPYDHELSCATIFIGFLLSFFLTLLKALKRRRKQFLKTNTSLKYENLFYKNSASVLLNNFHQGNMFHKFIFRNTSRKFNFKKIKHWMFSIYSCVSTIAIILTFK